jgi:hypothetical protein
VNPALLILAILQAAPAVTRAVIDTIELLRAAADDDRHVTTDELLGFVAAARAAGADLRAVVVARLREGGDWRARVEDADQVADALEAARGRVAGA